MTNRNNTPANNPTRFGARVSRTHPTLEVGEYQFETRLITVAEDRALTRKQAALPKGELDPDTGLAADLTPDQLDETVTIMSDITAELLARRILDGDPANITTEWVLDNMVSNDFGPLMNFLRVGHPAPEHMVLDAIGDDSGGDPNADRPVMTTG